MIIHKGTLLSTVFRLFVVRNWPVAVLVIAIQLLTDALHPYLGKFETRVYSAEAVAMLATVVGIFLVFRVNEAYQRWWEARTIWGSLVNSSRAFGRKVVTLLSADRIERVTDAAHAHAVHESLLLRHVAFVNALRLRLRRQEEGLGELEPFLDEAELNATRAASNPPLLLLRRQADQLGEILGPDTAEQLLLVELQATVDRFDDAQGACERIKNTTFPDRVAYMSEVFTWAMAVMIPVVFLDPREDIYPTGLLTVYFITLSFFVVQQLGVHLKNPFENKPNDTPMTALCRGIERDLREQLGHSPLPPPVEPVAGVLM